MATYNGIDPRNRKSRAPRSVPIPPPTSSVTPIGHALFLLPHRPAHTPVSTQPASSNDASFHSASTSVPHPLQLHPRSLHQPPPQSGLLNQTTSPDFVSHLQYQPTLISPVSLPLQLPNVNLSYRQPILVPSPSSLSSSLSATSQTVHSRPASLSYPFDPHTGPPSTLETQLPSQSSVTSSSSFGSTSGCYTPRLLLPPPSDDNDSRADTRGGDTIRVAGECTNGDQNSRRANTVAVVPLTTITAIATGILKRAGDPTSNNGGSGGDNGGGDGGGDGGGSVIGGPNDDLAVTSLPTARSSSQNVSLSLDRPLALQFVVSSLPAPPPPSTMSTLSAPPPLPAISTLSAPPLAISAHQPPRMTTNLFSPTLYQWAHTVTRRTQCRDTRECATFFRRHVTATERQLMASGGMCRYLDSAEGREKTAHFAALSQRIPSEFDFSPPLDLHTSIPQKTSLPISSPSSSSSSSHTVPSLQNVTASTRGPPPPPQTRTELYAQSQTRTELYAQSQTRQTANAGAPSLRPPTIRVPPPPASPFSITVSTLSSSEPGAITPTSVSSSSSLATSSRKPTPKPTPLPTRSPTASPPPPFQIDSLATLSALPSVPPTSASIRTPTSRPVTVATVAVTTAKARKLPVTQSRARTPSAKRPAKKALPQPDARPHVPASASSSVNASATTVAPRRRHSTSLPTKLSINSIVPTPSPSVPSLSCVASSSLTSSANLDGANPSERTTLPAPSVLRVHFESDVVKSGEQKRSQKSSTGSEKSLATTDNPRPETTMNLDALHDGLSRIGATYNVTHVREDAVKLLCVALRQHLQTVCRGVVRTAQLRADLEKHKRSIVVDADPAELIRSINAQDAADAQKRRAETRANDLATAHALQKALAARHLAAKKKRRVPASKVGAPQTISAGDAKKNKSGAVAADNAVTAHKRKGNVAKSRRIVSTGITDNAIQNAGINDSGLENGGGNGGGGGSNGGGGGGSNGDGGSGLSLTDGAGGGVRTKKRKSEGKDAGQMSTTASTMDVLPERYQKLVDEEAELAESEKQNATVSMALGIANMPLVSFANLNKPKFSASKTTTTLDPFSPASFLTSTSSAASSLTSTSSSTSSLTSTSSSTSSLTSTSCSTSSLTSTVVSSTTNSSVAPSVLTTSTSSTRLFTPVPVVFPIAATEMCIEVVDVANEPLSTDSKLEPRVILSVSPLTRSVSPLTHSVSPLTHSVSMPSLMSREAKLSETATKTGVEIGFMYEPSPWTESTVGDSVWGVVRPRRCTETVTSVAARTSSFAALFLHDGDGVQPPPTRTVATRPGSLVARKRRRADDATTKVGKYVAARPAELERYRSSLNITALDLLRFAENDARYKYSSHLDKIRQVAYKL